MATVEAEAITLRALECDVELPGAESGRVGEQSRPSTVCIHAVFFPQEALPLAMTFWRLTGLGLSSRRAELCCRNFISLREVAPQMVSSPLYSRWPSKERSHAHNMISQRIADLLERCPVGGAREVQVSQEDVYLYQSGMAAIYHLNQLLIRCKGSQSVLFGFTYELTLKMLEVYGPEPPRFYGFGDDHELDLFEAFVEDMAAEGRGVAAVWCECPSNPLLRVPDLLRLKKLADCHGFVPVVDDTIGTFGNVGLLGVADVVVTSLTKSFSGYTDVMGGRYGLLLRVNSSVYC